MADEDLAPAASAGQVAATAAYSTSSPFCPIVSPITSFRARLVVASGTQSPG